jgi:hypothetical protein
MPRDRDRTVTGASVEDKARLFASGIVADESEGRRQGPRIRERPVRRSARTAVSGGLAFVADPQIER